MKTFAAFPLMLVAVTGCYPDFQFDDTGGNGGEPSSSRAGSTSNGIGGMNAGGTTSDTTGSNGTGGDGDGGAMHLTTSQTTATSTSTGVMDPLPCGDGNGGIADCPDADDGCCLSLDDPADDACQVTTDCGSDFYTLLCNGPADCPDEICCALFEEDLFGSYFSGFVQCEAACAAPSRRLCEDASDCEAGESCTQLFSNDFAPEYAPHYKYCND